MNKSIFMLIGLSVLLVTCTPKNDVRIKLPESTAATDNFSIKENCSVSKIRGQVVYLPLYSNVPYFENKKRYDLSGFIAVHNTDFKYSLKITRVLFFDNDGKLSKNYLQGDIELAPMASTNFTVVESDQSGTGANFIVEWVADSLVNEPLIESVMLGLKNNQGVSFLSTGKVLRQTK